MTELFIYRKEIDDVKHSEFQEWSEVQSTRWEHACMENRLTTKKNGHGKVWEQEQTTFERGIV